MVMRQIRDRTGALVTDILLRKEKTARRSPKGERTRAKILDAAESLFALLPFESVFQRDVAARAEVLSGLVTHHYPTKASLFDAVAARRAAELNEQRRDRLAALVDPTIAAILDAYFLPLVERAKMRDDGWNAYFKMMSKFLYSDIGTEVGNRYYKGVTWEFVHALSKAAPETDRSTLTRAFLYSSDILLTSIFLPDRHEEIVGSDPEARGEVRQTADAYVMIRPFILGGFEALTRRTRAAG